MDLTREDVEHVALLARISIEDNEIDKYQKQLNQILNEMKRINEVDLKSDEILISPSENSNVYREDVAIDENIDILSNAPKTNGNYIEIKRFVND